MYHPGHHADCRRAAIDYPFRGGSELPSAAPPDCPRALDARNCSVGPCLARLGTSAPHRSPNPGSRSALTASGRGRIKPAASEACRRSERSPAGSPAGDFHFSATVDLSAYSRSGAQPTQPQSARHCATSAGSRAGMDEPVRGRDHAIVPADRRRCMWHPAVEDRVQNLAHVRSAWPLRETSVADAPSRQRAMAQVLYI